MKFNKGDNVEIVKKCGAKFADEHRNIVGEEFYEVGERYTVLDVVLSNTKEYGLRLKDNAKLLVPFQFVKKQSC